MIDIHAHVLPGLDDGPANMGEALALVRAAAEDHIDTIVATPHMLDGIYNAQRRDIFAAVTELNEAIKEHGIPITVLAGADIHSETEIPELLRQGELVTIADLGKHIILELPPDVVPRELDQLLFAIQLQGVQPIISHPERNRVIQEDPGELVPLVEAGSLAQVTAASVIGDFGQRVQEAVKTLFEWRLAHFVATDAHGITRRRPKLSEGAAQLREMIGPDEAAEILQNNPEAVIHGRRVRAPEPRPPKPRRHWFFW